MTSRRSLDQDARRDNKQIVEQDQWAQDGQYSGMNWDCYHGISEQENTSDN